MTEPDVDVLIIGAGLSGIGAAAHLTSARAGSAYAILEARDAIGGTWDLFRYPGVRSDSDLHTFSYGFKPWLGNDSLVDGASILRYLQEAAAERRIDDRIRFGHRVRAAHWSTADACWRVHAERRRDDGEVEPVVVSARWLVCAGGYYSYERGHDPELAGRDRFTGRIVHPQFWPADLDCAGRRVLIVGSGATAITLVPALAETAGHVTMVQRTPTYVLSVAGVDPLHAWLTRRVGAVRAHRISRRVNLCLDRLVYAASRRYPAGVRRLIRWLNLRALPGGYDVDTHFNPPYDPWDQRMCVARDGDLFAAISSGRAEIVTGRISHLTETGLALENGRELAADVIVTATGLRMVPLAGVSYTVDGRPVRLGETVAYKEMMLSGVPNFVYALGYANASWTLKVDLVFEHWCRLLRLMDERGHAIAVPQPPPPGLATAPVVDLSSGYVTRAASRFPRRGPRPPWRLATHYRADRRLLLDGPVGDHMSFAQTRSRDGSHGDAPLARVASGGRSAPGGPA